jgi:putative ABC transport system permease protein
MLNWRHCGIILGFELVLTVENLLWGLGISAFIGVLSGFIPAWSASRLDPVEAIRSNG